MLTIHHGLVAHSFGVCVILEGYPTSKSSDFQKTNPDMILSPFLYTI